MIPLAKKSLGQNWLNSPGALAKIIEISKLDSTDLVLEIGPGLGALTEKILETGASVLAIEKDHRLIEFLKTKFAKYIETKQLILQEGDILKIDLGQLIGSNQYKLIANLPYYITGQVLRLFLSTKFKPSLACLLVQKEVAERLVAKNNKESLLSLSVKAYGLPSYIKTVKRGSFNPSPKVDSAIILIDNISTKFFKKITEETFFTLIKKGFGSKRKMLKTNLNLKDEIFLKCHLSPKIRAEDLTLTDWHCLITEINSKT